MCIISATNGMKNCKLISKLLMIDKNLFIQLGLVSVLTCFQSKKHFE